MEKYIRSYINNIKQTIDNINTDEIIAVADILLETYKSDRRIFVMGNGGSASTASHMACDLAKGTSCEGKKRFSVISLNDNTAHFTAIANDISYEDIFSEQLKNILQKGDLVLVISASGNSPNLIKAMKYARLKGAKTAALLGFSGGECKELADVYAHIKKNDYGIVEDIHLMIEHMITKYFKDKIKSLDIEE